MECEFEKWRAICASVGGVLVWVVWVAYQRVRRGWHTSVGDMSGLSAWERLVMRQCGWRTKVSSVGDIAGNTRVLDSIVGGALFLKLFPKAHRK